MKVWDKLKALFIGPATSKIHSFTYFIPAPPKRKGGYREKQFDKVFFEFINRGFEIISVHTQALSSQSQPGMWVMITAKETKNFSAKSEEGLDWPFHSEDGPAILEAEIQHDYRPTEIAADDSAGDDEVDGLYFIKNHKS